MVFKVVNVYAFLFAEGKEGVLRSQKYFQIGRKVVYEREWGMLKAILIISPSCPLCGMFCCPKQIDLH